MGLFRALVRIYAFRNIKVHISFDGSWEYAMKKYTWRICKESTITMIINIWIVNHATTGAYVLK